MSYLADFQKAISHHDYPQFLKLWEEYCQGETVDAAELCAVLQAAKAAEFAESFGRHVDKILPLWQMLPDTEDTNEALRLIVDVQSTNASVYADLAQDFILKHYKDVPHLQEKLRIVGLRGKASFQGAIRNFELLEHMEKRKFVFHSGGWGVGEILEFSLLREQVGIEFDYVAGKRDLTFATSFQTLIAIPDEHFLAQRFGDPDALEKRAKEEPLEVIRLLLRDLGPKTAAEIKEELCDLVIPANGWNRWWQNARAKIKKDTRIETPEDLRAPFRLLQESVSHETRLQKALEKKPDAETLIQMVYTFMKDFPETLKSEEFRKQLALKIREVFSFGEIDEAQELQLHYLLADLGGETEYTPIVELIKRIGDIDRLLKRMNVLAFKKRTLTAVREHRPDWKECFVHVFKTVDLPFLRDYIASELLAEKPEGLLEKICAELAKYPTRYPEAFYWYFQKLLATPTLPFARKGDRPFAFEGLLTLLAHLENDPKQREFAKKIIALITDKRFAIVRQIMKEAKIDQVREFLLLASKCHSLSTHDKKILDSLAEVAHPALAGLHKKAEGAEEPSPIWTTLEGYQKLQQRIQQIATVETVENAKEIEIARAHGDLRENAEFKAALEKRDRLQAELKALSQQLNLARVLTKEDISTTKVGVGTKVLAQSPSGEKMSYSLLGPWDADPDKNILSFQSKLAQQIKDLSVGDTFRHQDVEYTITSIESYL